MEILEWEQLLKNNLDVENNVAIGQNYSGSKDAPVNGIIGGRKYANRYF